MNARPGRLLLAACIAWNAPLLAQGHRVEGNYRAVLDIAGGPLRFGLTLRSDSPSALSNGTKSDVLPPFRLVGDSIVIDIPDYAATITARPKGDSLIGFYRNVGNRGPREIPFRAERGRWKVEHAPASLIGRWDANWILDGRTSPRVIQFQDSTHGMEGTIVSNTGDYGIFWGRAEADSFSMSHFDGSYVYMLTGRLDGDTLRGIFHAGLRTQTPFVAVRSTGRPYLRDPLEITQADTSAFRFSFPDLNGNLVTEKDPRFQGKVLLVDIFGTWCPTCHDAAPVLTSLWRKYHSRGLEIVGLAYEVTGDPAADGRQLRIFRDKFDVPYDLLLAGTNDTQAAAATQPQLIGFTSFPTSIFIGRDGKVRKIHAGFYGPAMGQAHTNMVRQFEQTIEQLLADPAN
jgi:thiol-disulfide isomerase/thioredoxin